MKITVFTPTYNRGYILKKAYESLCNQSVKDFEWIILDDGSTDDTTDKVQLWMKSNNGFTIVYEKVENGGKMRAVNRGLQLAKGELFLNLDSDDYLDAHAIEIIIKWEKTISNQKNKFAGVAGLKAHFDGSLVGKTFKGEYLDACVTKRNMYGIMGDRAEIFYTELFRRYPLPEIEGEKFISEGVTWMEICCEENKILRWFNESIYYCEYLVDGYSQQALELPLNNPIGLCLNVNKQIKYTNPSYFRKLELWHSYLLVAKKLNITSYQIRKNLNITIFDYYFVLIGKKAKNFVRSFKI